MCNRIFLSVITMVLIAGCTQRVEHPLISDVLNKRKDELSSLNLTKIEFHDNLKGEAPYSYFIVETNLGEIKYPYNPWVGHISFKGSVASFNGDSWKLEILKSQMAKGPEIIAQHVTDGLDTLITIIKEENRIRSKWMANKEVI